ncbi:baseplate hub protein [Caballeronia sp. LZ035]|uniref:baseplate hub protein n=1 Tax=Caballeronia sp. LZ035 TaxID=3038568 RepID=UPI00285AE0D8|nr:hypothetical protein [Caballeronia sp. LZ035]MDR5757649.1 hypothetical protein [Caballeronia sp. LZ035]
MAGQSIGKRLIRIAFQLPRAGGDQSAPTNPFDANSGTVILDESFNMNVRIKKAALAYQNVAHIQVTNLPQHLREQLLTNFNQYRSGQLENFGTRQPLARVWIAAGYEYDPGTVGKTSGASTIFVGEVSGCSLIEGPPNITVEITARTHQSDKSRYVAATDPKTGADNAAPTVTTFRQFALWGGKQLGFDEAHIKFSSSYGDYILQNPGTSIVMLSAIVPALQDRYWGKVAAFIDDDFLYVMDMRSVINKTDLITLNEFIGVPCWTEVGVEGVVFMNTEIRLAHGAKFLSSQNPSLNGTYVIMELEYMLTTRQTPFYVKVSGYPPADSDNAVINGTA